MPVTSSELQSASSSPSGQSNIISHTMWIAMQYDSGVCTVILKEVIQNYIEGRSNVYCCLLDASKAFDKVHYGKLFTILLAKNVSLHVIRLLIDSYVRQQACVSWNGFKSNYFILQNGVKQGGVLSPVLLIMYIDNILTKLKHS